MKNFLFRYLKSCESKTDEIESTKNLLTRHEALQNASDRREFLISLSQLIGTGLIAPLFLPREVQAWTAKRQRQSSLRTYSPLGTSILDGTGLADTLNDTRSTVFGLTQTIKIGTNVKAVTLKAWGGGGGSGGRWSSSSGGAGGAGGYAETKLILGTDAPRGCVLSYIIGAPGGGGMDYYDSAQGGQGTGVWVGSLSSPTLSTIVLSAGGGGGGGAVNWAPASQGGRGGGGGESSAGAGGYGPAGAGGTSTGHGAGAAGNVTNTNAGAIDSSTTLSFMNFRPTQAAGAYGGTLYVNHAGGGGGMYRGGPGYAVITSSASTQGCGGGGGANHVAKGINTNTQFSTSTIPFNDTAAGGFGRGGSGNVGNKGNDGTAGRLIIIFE